MEAEIYDPATAPGDVISVTPAARTHLARQLAKEDAEAVLLDITESGCNGYMYAFKFIAGDPGAARVFEFDDVRVFVAEAHWPLVRGTEIDYVTEGLNSALAFRNPNASGECGCGESFSVEQAEGAPAGAPAVP